MASSHLRDFERREQASVTKSELCMHSTFLRRKRDGTGGGKEAADILLICAPTYITSELSDFE